MAQVTDYTVSNQTFPNTRADLNNIFAAIATNNSGTSAPSNQQAGQWWIDTTSSTWILYIHDGTDDIQFATIDTSANTVNFTDSALDVVTDTTPQLGGDLDLNSNDITGTGNINITGTVTATSFSGDGSSLTGITSVGGATGVDFNDNVKARFGTGNDLSIYHNGSHSIIEDVGTGKLEIRSNGTGVDIQKENAEFMARFITDGAVELYHDHSKKFETTSGGVNVTGTVTATAFSGDGSSLTGISASVADGSITMAKLSTSATEGDNVKQRVAKAWVNFNGTGTVAIRDDFNVSSITDNSTGEYTVNYSTNLGNSNYAISICAGKAGGSPSSSNSSIAFAAEAGTFGTSGFNIVITTSAGSVVDRDYVSAIAFGDS